MTLVSLLLLESVGHDGDLHENRVSGDELQELFANENSEYTLTEGTDEAPLPKGVIGILSFPIIQEGDRLNKNGRIYPWDLLKGAVKRHVDEAVSTRQSVVFDGHPGYREAKPTEIAAVLAKVEINESEKTVGPAEFHIVGTRAGRDILELARAGVKIGTSSRMKGTTKHGKHGAMEGAVVQPGLVAAGWDLVTNPSVARATAGSLREEDAGADRPPLTEDSMDPNKIKNIAELREHYPALAALIEKELTPTIREAALKDPAHLTEAKKALKPQLDADFTRRLEENEERIRDELKEEFEGPLNEEKKKLETAQGEVTKLTEQVNKLTKEKENLAESSSGELKKVQDDLKKLQESQVARDAEIAADKARAYIIEQTDGSPLAEQLRVMSLGVKSDTNPRGVEVGDKLKEEYKDVVAPKTLEEATRTLTSIKRMAGTFKVTTTRAGDGSGPLDESTSAKPGEKGRSRLQSLAGVDGQ